MGAPCRILILDDDLAHATAVRKLLAEVTTEQWHWAGAESFSVREEDVEVANASAPYIADWQKRKACSHDVIICDVHMPPDDGALPVFRALRDVKQSPPPCLVVMTQYKDKRDAVSQDIERLRGRGENPVPCIVTPKYKDMPGVADKLVQLDRTDWRNLIVRAIVGRQDHKTFKRLGDEVGLLSKIQTLAAFKGAFAEGRNAQKEPMIVVVSEPDGLQKTFARAWTDKVEWLPQYNAETFRVLLFGDGPYALDKLRTHEAFAIDRAEQLLAHAESPDGKELGERLRSLKSGKVLMDSAAGPVVKDFRGQLILCVAPTPGASGVGSRLASSSICRDAVKIGIPTYAAVRRNAAEASQLNASARDDLLRLIDFMLGTVSVDHLDRAVMAAYDWNYGFDGSGAGIDAIRHCVKWLALEADGNKVRPGIVAAKLTASDEGRQSVYAYLGRDDLLLYILMRLSQDFGEDTCLAAAALVYFKTLATVSEIVDRAEIVAPFWRTGGLFDKLANLHQYRLQLAESKQSKTWPNVSDAELYKPAQANKDSDAPKVSRSLQERLAKECAAISGDAESESRRRIAVLWQRLSRRGPKAGATQLAVLDRQYLTT